MANATVADVDDDDDVVVVVVDDSGTACWRWTL